MKKKFLQWYHGGIMANVQNDFLLLTPTWDRWEGWDDKSLRSYLYTYATTESKQKKLVTAKTRMDLLNLIDQWMASDHCWSSSSSQSV